MLFIDFEKIARDHYAALHSRALQLTRDPDFACDLVQSTFERCLRRLPRDLPEEKVRGWLLVVMRNHFTDCVRASGFRWTALEEVEDCLQTSDDEPAASAPWESFCMDDVRVALTRLPDGLRRPYEMHVMAHLSYREIARLLKITVVTVGTRIHRARRQLCDALTGEVRQMPTCQEAIVPTLPTLPILPTLPTLPTLPILPTLPQRRHGAGARAAGR